jgi:hypothetical protein
MTLEEQMDFLDESIRKLKTQYDLYFAGMRRVPPTWERGKLDSFVHEMSRLKIRETGVRFRFNALIARYNHYRELWSRLAREREEGPMDYRRRLAALQEAEHKLAAPAQAAESSLPGEPPVTSGDGGSYVMVTPSLEPASVSRLYEDIVQAQKALGKALPSADQVGVMVQKQAESLRERYGVSNIAFRVEVVDGKVKLKAKPLRDGQTQ